MYLRCKASEIRVGCLLSTFDRRETNEWAIVRDARRPRRVGGERTHLDKCTIWHCSRENRRPCARAAAAERTDQSEAFAPQPAPVLAGTTRLSIARMARASPSPADHFSVTTFHSTRCLSGLPLIEETHGYFN